MAELEATRENEARIAQAMGTPWMQPHHGTCCTCQTCGWPHEECKCNYLTDKSQVFPMMERLAELADAQVDMSSGRRGGICIELTDLRPSSRLEETEFHGATPSLAVAAALLSVWEEVQRERA